MKHVEKFYISDTHFCHDQMVGPEGWRPFSTMEEHDETILENIIKTVGSGNKLIHGGDFGMGKPEDGKLEAYLKRIVDAGIILDFLAIGNHCTDAKLKIYGKYFKKIHAYRTIGDDAILSHIPIHENQLGRWSFCIHGHIHKNIVMRQKDVCDPNIYEPDPRYINICVEQWDYKPIHQSVIWEHMRKHK